MNTLKAGNVDIMENYCKSDSKSLTRMIHCAILILGINTKEIPRYTLWNGFRDNISACPVYPLSRDVRNLKDEGDNN